MNQLLIPADRHTRAVAEALIDADALTTPKDVLHYFEKPHHYEAEARLWQDAGQPGSDDSPGWRRFVDGLEHLPGG